MADMPSEQMPQDKGRWRVAPAPDGRGTPEEHKPPPPHRLRWFWFVVAGLLAINLISVVMAQTSGEPRVKVPFSPYFVHQVDAGLVKSMRRSMASILACIRSVARCACFPVSRPSPRSSAISSSRV